MDWISFDFIPAHLNGQSEWSVKCLLARCYVYHAREITKLCFYMLRHLSKPVELSYKTYWPQQQAQTANVKGLVLPRDWWRTGTEFNYHWSTSFIYTSHKQFQASIHLILYVMTRDIKKKMNYFDSHGYFVEYFHNIGLLGSYFLKIQATPTPRHT